MARILVGVDGSESGMRAVDHAAKLAAEGKADLVLVTVSSLPFVLDDELKAYAHAEHLYKEDLPRLLADPRPPALEAARARAATMGVKNIESIAVGGDPATEIISAAERSGASLIVVGRRGMGRLSRLVFGSVAQKVVQLATQPVLVVP